MCVICCSSWNSILLNLSTSPILCSTTANLAMSSIFSEITFFPKILIIYLFIMFKFIVIWYETFDNTCQFLICHFRSVTKTDLDVVGMKWRFWTNITKNILYCNKMFYLLLFFFSLFFLILSIHFFVK